MERWADTLEDLDPTMSLGWASAEVRALKGSKQIAALPGKVYRSAVTTMSISRTFLSSSSDSEMGVIDLNYCYTVDCQSGSVLALDILHIISSIHVGHWALQWSLLALVTRIPITYRQGRVLLPNQIAIT